MERKTFIKSCGLLALGAPLASVILQSCTSYYYADFQEEEDQLVVPLSEFEQKEKDKTRSFVLLDAPISKYSICIFKTGKDDYTASLMRCTHKGCEVNVEGNAYHCPCHDSEFSNTGAVLEGPATEPLKTFKTKTDKKNLYVRLT